MELVFKTASQLAEMIRNHEVSSVEVVDAFIQQIQKHNPKLNAIVTLDEAGARRRALEADEALTQGVVWGQLHGVPVTIKDSFKTAGIRSTGGCKVLAVFNTVFNMTGHPVVTIPAGLSSTGLPIGVQIVGKRWGEIALLDAAEKIDKVAGGYRRPPGY